VKQTEASLSTLKVLAIHMAFYRYGSDSMSISDEEITDAVLANIGLVVNEFLLCTSTGRFSSR
jgi:hypothetical protein